MPNFGVVEDILLKEPNLILEGDLNITMPHIKVWGDQSRLDPLANFFSRIFQETNLIDVMHVDTFVLEEW